jgi:hypothetical protein
MEQAYNQTTQSFAVIAQEEYKVRAILSATNSSVIREHYSFVNTSEERELLT